jgi:hypothetical protein
MANFSLEEEKNCKHGMRKTWKEFCAVPLKTQY